MRIRSTRQTFLIAAMLSAAVPPTSTAQGDLVQLPGWVGAQRFRIITNVTPRPDRYILMDFANPLPGRETEFERSEKPNHRTRAEASGVDGRAALPTGRYTGPADREAERG
jgi:hypothetical protein